MRSKIISAGHYLPKKIITNKDMESIVETSDEWIQQRTGIQQRHFADENETTSDMAVKAAEMALENANLTGSDIDVVIVATTSPDYTFPATGVIVQDRIGMGDKGFGFDVQAVCSGFVYALSIADNFIKSGQVKRALVIGAEKFSNLLNLEDRTTYVLFGDGAGAVILEASTDDTSGILSAHLHSEGGQRDILRTTGGAGSNKTVGHIFMNGSEVFRHAVTRMSEVVQETLYANNIKADDIDWLVPHQANKRIIDSTAKKLNLGQDKIVLTVAQHGNTSAASIPLAFSTAWHDGRIKKGNLVLMEAMGAGLTWGAVLVRI